jgi:hypothetical protein
VDIKLSGETAGELARRPIQYDTGFTLFPGKYVLKFLARDAETGLDPRSKALPLKFSLSLSKLPPGEYNCQVTVLDPTNQKAAFWQAPVMLVP